MLLKIANHASFRYFIFIWLYCFYSPVAYATCSGLGCSCSVGTTAVAFGNYNPIFASTTTANGNVAVTCNALVLFTTAYVITLSAGDSGSFTTRFMDVTGNHLNYNLYTTAGFTSVWGDGTAGTSTVSDSYTAVALGPVTRNYTVFGRVPALQALPAGVYIDSVTVTVTY